MLQTWIDSKTVSNSIYEIMIGSAELKESIRQTELDFLDLVPAHINLVGAEIEMIDREERERILKKAVADATGLSLEEAEAIVTFHGRK